MILIGGNLMHTDLTILYGIKREIDHVTGQFLGQYDLTLEQYLLLSFLEKSGSTTTKIADILGVSKPAVSRRLRELHKKGWVKRTRTDDDLRSDYRVVIYRLTSVGQEIFDEGYRSVERLLANFGEDSLLDQVYQELRILNRELLE